MKKKPSLSDNEILSINQDQNLRKTGKVFQGIMSFRKTSSLSEFTNYLPRSLVNIYIYIYQYNKKSGWEQHQQLLSFLF